jgi:hypothetical protein
MTNQEVKNMLAASCVKDQISPVFTNEETLRNAIDIGSDLSELLNSSISANEFGLDSSEIYVINDVMETEFGVVLLLSDSNGDGYALSTIDFEGEYLDLVGYVRDEIDAITEEFGDNSEFTHPEIGD